MDLFVGLLLSQNAGPNLQLWRWTSKIWHIKSRGR